MNLNLEDKVIIITGGTKGIGGGISRCVAEEGGIPIFIGRSIDTGEQLYNELKSKNQKGFFIQADMTDREACKKIVDITIEKYGRIDGLVNNAGTNDGIGLENGSPEAFSKSVSYNLDHYYNMAYYCLDSLKKTKGSILNISSKTALTGQGNTSGYAASKGAQLALTREWAVELLKYNIRVNAIVPSEVMTPQYDTWLQTFDEPEKRKGVITKNIPLEQRMTSIEEIANTAVFLLSDKSSHTTGQQLFVDGGYVHLDRSL